MSTHRVEERGKRTRLAVDVSPDLRRRIKVAAAESDQSVRDYVVGILEQAVPARRSDAGVVAAEMVRSFEDFRKRVTGGKLLPDDSTDILREVREERTNRQ